MVLSWNCLQLFLYFHHLGCGKKTKPKQRVRNLKAFVILPDAVQCEMAINQALPPQMTVRLAEPQEFGDLDPELVGLRQHHLQDGHEGWRLTEVAVADNVGVDVEALCVASGLYAPGYVV